MATIVLVLCLGIKSSYLVFGCCGKIGTYVCSNKKNPKPNLDKDIVDSASEFFFCANNGLITKQKILKCIRWEKPRAGWLILNTDGVVTGNTGQAGGGGLIRDENGGWVTGFTRKIENTNSYMAELWAFRDGLQLCLQMNAHSVIIELDAKVVVDALNSPNSPNSFSSSILEECRHVANQLPRKIFRHVYREANKCADLLARIGLLLDNDFIVFSSPPMDLASVLKADANGVYVNRLCSEPLFAV